MSEKLDPIGIFIATFSISSFAGLAALLRSRRQLSPRAVCSAMLNSGILGLLIGLLWYRYFDGQDNLWFLVGVSGLAGLGGISLLDFLIQTLQKGYGFNITIQATPDKEDDA